MDSNKGNTKGQGSVVHVTITAAGTAVYTQTATSYSYIPSYSTVGSETGSSSPSAGSNHSDSSSNNGGSQSSSVNKGAIIGGVVGGVAAIALIGLLFFLTYKKRRSARLSKTLQHNNNTYMNDYLSSTANAAALATNHGNRTTPEPRHLVAPLPHPPTSPIAGDTIREGDGVDSKYYDMYYQDRASGSPGLVMKNNAENYYNDYSEIATAGVDESRNSVALDSTTVDGNFGSVRHVPNEMDRSYDLTSPMSSGEEGEQRHIPHLKDDNTTTVEPPHSKE